MKNIKIVLIILLLLFLIYPAFGFVNGPVFNYQSGREFRGYVAPPVTNPQQNELPSYMYKISSDLLEYIFPESRTEYYDEACSRLMMIQNKALISADQLGPQGQSIGDIAYVEVHINSQYMPEAEPYFYSIQSTTPFPGQIWIWGWVSIDNVRKLSKQGWVYSLSLVEGSVSETMPHGTPSQDQMNIPSSSNYQTLTVKNTTWIKQTGIKYQINTTPVKLTNNRFILIK